MNDSILDSDFDWTREGDRVTFTRLYEELAPMLFAWATLRIPAVVRPWVDPEDIVQEAWWRAIDGIRRFDARDGGFRPWIFRIATHVLLESMRRQRPRNRLQAGERGAIASLPSDLIAEATSISRRAARSEQAAKVIEVMKSLDELERKLVLHCGFEGMSAREAGELCGVSEEACRKRWQRLRERLHGFPMWTELREA